MVAGLTRKNAPPLLSMVGGKRHANDGDHEEPARKRKQTGSDQLTKEQEEKDINAEPESSDDEMRLPVPRPAPASRPVIMASSKQEDPELKKPQRKSNRKTPAIRPLAHGTLEKGRIDNAKRRLEEDKENASATPPISSAGSVKDGPFEWGMEHASQGNKKKAKGYGTKNRTTNIHHAQPPRKAGSGSLKGSSRAKNPRVHSRNVKPQSPGEEDSESEVSMKDLEMDEEALEKTLFPNGMATPDPELRTTEAKTKRTKEGKARSKPTAIDDDDELDKLLEDSSKDQTSKEKAKASKSARLLGQLGDWMENQAPPSSQPGSSAPQEDLDNLNDYIQQLPKEEEEGTRCTLCKEPVESEHYWEFWKGKDKTVKNHTAFCTAHRRKSAQEEYEREGYPKIDWDALPKRIRKHRMELFQVLNNDRPSQHRDRYEPLALTGKAAAVPSRRKDLPEHVQEELESYALDDQATFPGYYGPHGRRAITESIMKVLKNEVKNSEDSVVQGSGPAAFIQAVLVPEMAILLIMEDCLVDREEAELIREKTYDMGLLLNEEIEDEIEGLLDSEDENEYQHR